MKDLAIEQKESIAAETGGCELPREGDIDLDDYPGFWTDKTTTEARDEGEASEGSDGRPRPAAQSEAEARYKIKYNGEEKELPVSELCTLAQKGMNYDKLQGRLAAAENRRELQVLARCAAANGMDTEHYLEHLQTSQVGAELQRLLAEGVPEDAARQLVQLRQQEAERALEAAQKAAEKAQTEQFVELVRRYPEVQQLPQEVSLLVAQGVPPLYAYESYKNRELKTRLAAREASENTRKTAAGSATGLAEDELGEAFLAGFMRRRNDEY